MYIRCKPYKAEEIILQIRKLAIGGNLKAEKVLMSEESWMEMFGDERQKDNLSGVPVVFSDITGKDTFVMLGPAVESTSAAATKTKAKTKKSKAKK